MPEPVSQARRGRGRPGYDQATVLRRAIDLFNRKGYEAASVADLADELGFSKSALYHHVPSKEHLLAQALDEALAELTAVIEAATGGPGGTDGSAAADDRGGTGESGGSAYERLRSVVRQSVEVLVAAQPAVTLLLRVRGNSEVELQALQRRRRIDAQLADLVRAAAAEGAIRDDLPPDLVSRLIFGMVNSLVEWYRPDGELTAAAVAGAITAIAFEGLATRSA
jgi:AcrR family transcriptional regulator